MWTDIRRLVLGAALGTMAVGVAGPVAAAEPGVASAAVAFSVSDVTEFEGTLKEDPGCPPDITCRPIKVPNSMHFEVTINTTLSVPVKVHVKTVNDTAKAGLDYVGITDQVITIPAGKTTAWVTVQLKTDVVSEPAETFKVELFNPSIAASTADQGEGKILDGFTTIASTRD
jgi:Calx-beta domain